MANLVSRLLKGRLQACSAPSYLHSSKPARHASSHKVQGKVLKTAKGLRMAEPPGSFPIASSPSAHPSLSLLRRQWSPCCSVSTPGRLTPEKCCTLCSFFLTCAPLSSPFGFLSLFLSLFSFNGTYSPLPKSIPSYDTVSASFLLCFSPYHHLLTHWFYLVYCLYAQQECQHQDGGDSCVSFTSCSWKRA